MTIIYGDTEVETAGELQAVVGSTLVADRFYGLPIKLNACLCQLDVPKSIPRGFHLEMGDTCMDAILTKVEEL
jgi:hypothetical protein